MGATSLWRHARPLLLASTSPTRRALLTAAGLTYETEPPGIDERALQAGLSSDASSGQIALSLARAKALAVSQRRGDQIVLGADQTLGFEGQTLSKPGSRDATRSLLARLAGREHRLHTAAVLAQNGRILAEIGAEARLTMRPLDRIAIAAYVEAAGPDAPQCAGGYQVEGLGVHLFAAIEGEHSVILGLPMLPLLSALRRLDYLAW